MLKSVVVSGALTAALLLGSTGLAASAADKATARELATAGIDLFRSGKYVEALDKLKRAEELYDVPVHLLYIARSQEKLGQLVESAETYRQLDHYSMPPGAPPAWVSAQEDGRKELPGVEPRVPKLRVVLEPKDLDGTNLTIDGNAVSAAVVGVERPINPGKHHVEATAKGYKTASGDIELAEKETKDLTLKLEKAPPGTEGASGAANAGATSGAATGEKRSVVGFMFGLRLHAAVPTGKLMRDPITPTKDINVSDAFQPGAGVEFHAGVRVAQYFTPLLFIEGNKYSPGSGLLGADAQNPSGASAGIGVMVGTPPGKMGGFGELDFAPLHTLSVTAHETVTNKDCKVTFSGGAFRFGGGGTFPVLSWLNLTPFAMVTISKANKLENSGCSRPAADQLNAITSSDLRTHEVILLGVGGDVILGQDH